MKRSVLVVGTELDRVEVNMMAGVVRAGWKVHALVSPEARYGAELEQAGISVSRLSQAGRVDPRAILGIRRELKRGRYSILHCLSARAVSNGLLASFGINVRKVAYRGTMGNVSWFDPSSWLTFLNPSLDRIICVSGAVEGFLAQYVPKERLVTIHKGHDPVWYERAAEHTLSVFGVPETAFVIGCVANMRPLKGVPVLLEAFDMLPESLGAHLVLVGRVDKETENALRQGRQRPDRIHVVGYTEKPSLLVSQMDCYVQPSLVREGLPKSLLEAMCLGVVPIVTDIGGMPEVVSSCKNGFVVPPRDPVAIAAAIQEIAANGELRMRFSAEAHATMQGELHVSRSISKLLNVYEELLA